MDFLNALKKYVKSEWYNLKHKHKIKLLSILVFICFSPISVPIFIVCFFGGIIIALFPGKKEYDKSEYKAIVQMSYFKVIFRKGMNSEYLTWKILNNQPEFKKVMINLYIPNGENTSEIDSVLINQNGIFVVESKGFRGWIYGNETDKRWRQNIYSHITEFYNPVRQNRNHIKVLAEVLNIKDMNIFRSYIVFGEGCELKKVTITKPNLRVIQRHDLENALNTDFKTYGKVLTDKQIIQYYDTLYKYMFTDEKTKLEHIAYVNSLKEGI